MRKRSIILLAILAIVSGCQGNNPAKTKIESEESKTFYAIGAMFGSRLQGLSMSDEEIAALSRGLYEAAKKEKAVVDIASYQKKVQDMFKTRTEKNSVEAKKKGAEFLEKFKKEAGVKVTASGLAYKVISEGTGNMPKPTDTVEVHYHGTLIDGTVFDSSVERGKKISFPLNRVIKGWTEGLQLIKTGGKIKLVIPPELAYGEQGAPPKIPPSSTLSFEVELFTIQSAAEKTASAAGAAKVAPKPAAKAPKK